MKTRTVTTAAASLFTFAVAVAALAGCAVEPGADADATSSEAAADEHDDGSLGTVEQGLGPSQPCEFIPGGCEGGGGQDDGPPEHTNKGMVKVCATARTACYKKCKGTNAQIIACQTKCTKAHKECLEDY